MKRVGHLTSVLLAATLTLIGHGRLRRSLLHGNRSVDNSDGLDQDEVHVIVQPNGEDVPTGRKLADDYDALVSRKSECREDDRCKKCEGDCDHDEDCIGDLACFQRSGNKTVPGCNGLGVEKTDYCYDPNDDLDSSSEMMLRHPECTHDDPCARCEGDCDGDSDCAGSLKCFQRTGYGRIPPGCTGSAEGSKDYCYDPDDEPLFSRDPECNDNKKCSKCEGDCDSDDECAGDLRCFKRTEKQQVPGCALPGFGRYGKDYCYDPRDDPGYGSELYYRAECDGDAGNKCMKCEGDCDHDKDCAGELRCFFRKSDEVVPGCSGSGRRGKDYCHDPRDDPSYGLELYYRAECDVGNKCMKCEGDCDHHKDCAGELRCFYRKSDELVPGCSGSGRTGKDYCYDPQDDPNHGLELYTRHDDCEIDDKCKKCEGDCDVDEDCAGELKCFKRGGLERVPGCAGEGEYGKDYCIDPTENPDFGSDLFDRDPECTDGRPCNRCEGDCDDDKDCEGELICFKRNGTDPIPGCSGNGTYANDYCTAPEDVPGPDPKCDGDNQCLFFREPECATDNECRKCEGDCDNHRECEGILRCFYRNSTEKVPGCSGEGVFGKNYCFDPRDNPSADPRGRRSGRDIVFYVLGDAPYKLEEMVVDFPNQIREISERNDADFILHVGDFQRTAVGKCEVSWFNAAANVLRNSSVPVFVTPGDNDWNSCDEVDTGVEKGWENWFSVFKHFHDVNWPSNGFDVSHQPGREENYAFFYRKMLLINVHLVNDPVQNVDEWKKRHQDNLNFTRGKLDEFEGEFKVVVILGHADPKDEHEPYFRDGIAMDVDALGVPFLYIHGSGHEWEEDDEFEGISNFLRIMIPGRDEKPVKVNINTNSESPFRFDRQNNETTECCEEGWPKPE